MPDPKQKGIHTHILTTDYHHAFIKVNFLYRYNHNGMLDNQINLIWQKYSKNSQIWHATSEVV